MLPHGFVVSEEKSPKLLTLIIDKKGILSEQLLSYIDKNIPTVLVTAEGKSPHSTTITIPFQKHIPEIPEGVYSHIFFVWEGKNDTLHILDPLLQKAAVDNAQFVFITDYHLFSPKLVDYIRQRHASATIILLGDLFGNPNYVSLTNDMFAQAHKKGVIPLNNVGLTTLYPALFSDVVERIVHVSFSGEKKRIFLGGYSEGITQLSIGHILQKIDPFIKIDFSNVNEETPTLPEDVAGLLPLSYPVVRKLQDAYTDYVVARKTDKPLLHDLPKFSVSASVKHKKATTKKHSLLWVSFFLLLVILLSPILLMALYGGLGGLLLHESVTSAKKGNFQQAVQFATTGKTLFSLAQQTEQLAGKELSFITLSSLKNTVDTTLAMGNTACALLVNGSVSAQSFQTVAQGKSLTPLADFSKGVSGMQNAIVLLSEMPQEGSIDGIKIKDINTVIGQYVSVLNILPQLFGFPQKKIYVILLQNNMELRPGGGFIGSYATVTIDHGRFGPFVVHDVYDADGQLQGHIEPPYVIRRYIPQVHWYLRDSNFDVDFLQNAKNAAFFLKQETGLQVDGVIGIDLSFVKNILHIVGPLYIPEYNQTVTADNFFLLTEEHAEKNTFAGSSQKKDFLRALFAALQTKLSTVKSVSVKDIFGMLQLVSEKHIVFGFSDPSLQGVFTANNMSSSLWDKRKVQANELIDFMGMNEANIGINKANAFVERQVTQTLAIADTGSVSGKLAITYTNNSKQNVWPGGPYKNYLRVILPLSAQLTDISFNTVHQHIISAVTDASVYEAQGFVAPTGLEVDSSVEQGKQIYGFVATIPVQETKTIYVTYTLAQKIDMSQPTFSYNINLFKQPGVDGYPYTFSLTVPSTHTVLHASENVTSSENSIFFKKAFDEDTQISATFTHK